ncbi:MAG: hypothetical protein A2511_02335 [Deltaproteobacteria bacterium RIFOXYD12_FULL_50_9]|nr:MAG: hypothetical protein A2511_02335 [Deltaproteobacteria bacterium RIFOXYD12_FULL_50_9]
MLPFKTPSKEWLTVITVFHDMAREAPRTLYSLSREYQLQAVGLKYRVIAIDHGSSTPLAHLPYRGLDLEYRRIETQAVSPVMAVNQAVESVSSEFVMINIDGARILSPGVLMYAYQACEAFRNPFVYTLGWHLGPDIQNISMTMGYSQHQEDLLLAELDWEHNGYRLFEKSSLAGSSAGGFLKPIAESNCFLIRTSTWVELGGFHPDFQTPGGGLANLDFFKRVCEQTDITPVCLLGEGTFHQIHGGVATNVPREKHPMPGFQEEYKSIHGQPWQKKQDLEPVYFGRLHKVARRFISI